MGGREGRTVGRGTGGALTLLHTEALQSDWTATITAAGFTCWNVLWQRSHAALDKSRLSAAPP